MEASRACSIWVMRLRESATWAWELRSCVVNSDSRAARCCSWAVAFSRSRLKPLKCLRVPCALPRGIFGRVQRLFQTA